jgi:hypothetical protein
LRDQLDSACKKSQVDKKLTAKVERTHEDRYDSRRRRRDRLQPVR